MGTATELTLEVTVRIDPHRWNGLRWPRIVTGNEILTVGRPGLMGDAIWITSQERVRWFCSESGADEVDANQILSQAGRVCVSLAAGPNHTVSARFPRSLLDGGAVL